MPRLPSVADTDEELGDNVDNIVSNNGLSVEDLTAQLAAAKLENKELKTKQQQHTQEYVLIKTDKDDLEAQNNTLVTVHVAALAAKDIEIAALRAAGGRPAVDPRLALLRSQAKMPESDIYMAGGNFNATNVEMTVDEKIAMYTKAISYKTHAGLIPDVDCLRLNRLAAARVAQCTDKAALSALLPDGIVVSSKTTKAQLQFIIPLYLTVDAFRAEAAEAAA